MLSGQAQFRGEEPGFAELCVAPEAFLPGNGVLFCTFLGSVNSSISQVLVVFPDWE